jgi:tetratricopeptide (TPR) repeat protein
MVNKLTDTLFQLIKSLEKAEKRHFKLFIQRSSGNHDLKVVELYDAIEKLTEYDEKVLLKKLKTIKKPQLSNIKVHLYKQLLASLRLLKSTESVDLQLNEQLDYAHILYKKGLYVQSLKILEKAKETAKNYNKVNFLLLAITLEKRIETLHITGSSRLRTEALAQEINEVNERIAVLSKLSNLALLMYSWFVQNGHAKNDEDHNRIETFINENLPKQQWDKNGFYEKMYIYQSYTWQAYIDQDFVKYYRYSQRWVNAFTTEPLMIRIETGHYIKGLHTLLNALFTVRNYKKMAQVIEYFKTFALTDRVHLHDNFRTQAFIYIHSAKLNLYSSIGQFDKAIKLVPHILKTLKNDELFIDEHRIMVFNYKIALLYFGNGNYDICIDYVQKIINENTEVRTDLQSYARILLLISHYELGNYDIMQYLTQSGLRFMQKKENLTIVEKSLFSFFQKPFLNERKKMEKEFILLYDKIKTLEKNKYETRSFAYIDILSWLQSKITKTTMQQILIEKNAISKYKAEV